MWLIEIILEGVTTGPAPQMLIEESIELGDEANDEPPKFEYDRWSLTPATNIILPGSTGCPFGLFYRFCLTTYHPMAIMRPENQNPPSTVPCECLRQSQRRFLPVG